jgi:hypothetical protein
VGTVGASFIGSIPVTSDNDRADAVDDRWSEQYASLGWPSVDRRIDLGVGNDSGPGGSCDDHQ